MNNHLKEIKSFRDIISDKSSLSDIKKDVIQLVSNNIKLGEILSEQKNNQQEKYNSFKNYEEILGNKDATNSQIVDSTTLLVDLLIDKSKENDHLQDIISLIQKLKENHQFKKSIFIQRLSESQISLRSIWNLHKEYIISLKDFLENTIGHQERYVKELQSIAIRSETEQIFNVSESSKDSILTDMDPTIESLVTSLQSQIADQLLRKLCGHESSVQSTSKNSLSSKLQAATLPYHQIFKIIRKIEDEVTIKLFLTRELQFFFLYPTLSNYDKYIDTLYDPSNRTEGTEELPSIITLDSPIQNSIAKELVNGLTAATIVENILLCIRRNSGNLRNILVISSLIVRKYGEEGSSLLTAMTNDIAKDSLETSNENQLKVSFLFSRQLFPVTDNHSIISYNEWIQGNFLIESRRKNIQFLLKFLHWLLPKDLIPYVKIHLKIFTKLKSNVAENFIIACRERINEIGEPITPESEKLVKEWTLQYEKNQIIPSVLRQMFTLKRVKFDKEILPALLNVQETTLDNNNRKILLETLLKEEIISKDSFELFLKRLQLNEKKIEKNTKEAANLKFESNGQISEESLRIWNQLFNQLLESFLHAIKNGISSNIQSIISHINNHLSILEENRIIETNRKTFQILIGKLIEIYVNALKIRIHYCSKNSKKEDWNWSINYGSIFHSFDFITLLFDYLIDESLRNSLKGNIDRNNGMESENIWSSSNPINSKLSIDFSLSMLISSVTSNRKYRENSFDLYSFFLHFFIGNDSNIFLSNGNNHSSHLSSSNNKLKASPRSAAIFSCMYIKSVCIQFEEFELIEKDEKENSNKSSLNNSGIIPVIAFQILFWEYSRIIHDNLRPDKSFEDHFIIETFNSLEILHPNIFSSFLPLEIFLKVDKFLLSSEISNEISIKEENLILMKSFDRKKFIRNWMTNYYVLFNHLENFLKLLITLEEISEEMKTIVKEFTNNYSFQNKNIYWIIELIENSLNSRTLESLFHFLEILPNHLLFGINVNNQDEIKGNIVAFIQRWIHLLSKATGTFWTSNRVFQFADGILKLLKYESKERCQETFNQILIKIPLFTLGCIRFHYFEDFGILKIPLQELKLQNTFHIIETNSIKFLENFSFEISKMDLNILILIIMRIIELLMIDLFKKSPLDNNIHFSFIEEENSLKILSKFQIFIEEYSKSNSKSKNDQSVFFFHSIFTSLTRFYSIIYDRPQDIYFDLPDLSKCSLKKIQDLIEKILILFIEKKTDLLQNAFSNSNETLFDSIIIEKSQLSLCFFRIALKSSVALSKLNSSDWTELILSNYISLTKNEELILETNLITQMKEWIASSCSIMDFSSSKDILKELNDIDCELFSRLKKKKTK